MGLSSLEFNFLYGAWQNGLLPQGGALLEFGECETFYLNAAAALKHLIAGSQDKAGLMQEMERLVAENLPSRAYDEVKLIYKALFAYDSYNAIDLAPGRDHCIQQDLNVPFNLGRQFDLCINNGTSEHVFDQASFYKAVHDHTKTGGTMIHWTTCLGYPDHGFYNIQPGFFHDLAHANAYEILQANLVTPQKMYDLLPGMIHPKNVRDNPDLEEALACVVIKKTRDSAFRAPIQQSFKALEQYTDKN